MLKTRVSTCDSRHWLAPIARCWTAPFLMLFILVIAACSEEAPPAATPSPDATPSSATSSPDASSTTDAVTHFEEGFAIEGVDQLRLVAGTTSDALKLHFDAQPESSLSVVAISGDPKRLANDHLQLTGQGLERELRIQAGTETGVASVSIVAFDGQRTARKSIQVEIIAAEPNSGATAPK